MGISVGINPPKTPVTKGSRGIAKNTIPNVCKMPGPPAPFVPTPLPNIGKSELSPKDYSKTVKIEGQTVAIRGATFESMGDMASKGTGGGLISANTHGPTKFITPGSMNVKIEGKSVHQLGEPMLNNCGPSGSPPNTGATMQGEDQSDADDAKCPPHELKWDELTEEAEQERRRKHDEKIAQHEQEMNDALDRAQQALTAGDQVGFNTAWENARGHEGNLTGKQFEKKVAEEANAIWTSVQFECTKCGMNGDIDVITETGTIKECKIPATARRDQVYKFEVAGPAILGAQFSGIHLAVPAAKMPNATASINNQNLQGRCGKQPH